MTTSLECTSPSPTLQLPHPPSPSSSEVSLPSSNSDQPSDATQDPELPSKHSQGSPSHNSHSPAKLERMTSTGPDALKKTVKDLQRSSVSLPRFQLLLEEVNNCFHTFISCNFKPVIQLYFHGNSLELYCIHVSLVHLIFASLACAQNNWFSRH